MLVILKKQVRQPNTLAYQTMIKALESPVRAQRPSRPWRKLHPRSVSTDDIPSAPAGKIKHIGSLMQIHVKKHVYEGQFEILGGRIIGIGDQALSIFILNRRALLAQEPLSFLRAVPANDRWRNFFCRKPSGVQGDAQGGNRLTHLATDGLLWRLSCRKHL